MSPVSILIGVFASSGGKLSSAQLKHHFIYAYLPITEKKMVVPHQSVFAMNFPQFLFLLTSWSLSFVFHFLKCWIKLVTLFCWLCDNFLHIKNNSSFITYLFFLINEILWGLKYLASFFFFFLKMGPPRFAQDLLTMPGIISWHSGQLLARPNSTHWTLSLQVL